MSTRYIFVSLTLLVFTMGVFAQQVKRKGVEPIDISKNKKKTGKPGEVYSIDIFYGKWQEVARENRAHEPAEITDTLFIKFVSRREVYAWEGNQPKLKGAASVDPPGNILSIVADEYTILSADKEKLVLFDEDKYIHTFKKVDQFYYETLGKLKVEQETFTKPVKATLKDITGRWDVYRRQARPGAIHPPTTIIHRLTIGDAIDANTAKGEIVFYVSTDSKMLPCKIKLDGMMMHITAENNTWDLNIYKANGEEFIFGDTDVILYYSKTF